MALRDQPYLPLYVQDYLTDEKLNMCSLSTQGVYIKIMCLFHKSDTYGGILLKQKDKQNSSTTLNFALKIAKLLPIPLQDINDAIGELLDEKVLTIDGDFMFQKRMIKDNEISIKRADSGKKGGIKSQSKNKPNKDQNASNFAPAKNEAKHEYENEYENEIVIDLYNWSKKFFSENYINDKALDLFDKLIRIDGYTPENIKRAIEWARNDDFWSANFLSPLKLRNRDKTGVKYIDVFLAKILKNETAITRGNNKKGCTWDELAHVVATEFGSDKG